MQFFYLKRIKNFCTASLLISGFIQYKAVTNELIANFVFSNSARYRWYKLKEAAYF